LGASGAKEKTRTMLSRAGGEADMTTPVGFVGLGNVGLPMAQNVLNAGYALHVFNRTAAKAEGLLAQGATWAPSPQVLAAQTGLVTGHQHGDR
jgi:glutamyl-tRNA reductase